MKAERRHELQQNSLAKFIDNLPVMARLYADRILLVVVLILLVIVLIRWRMNAAVERQVAVTNDLATARANVQRLQSMPLMGPAEQLANTRSKTIDEVNAAIDSISTNASSSDTALQARALLTRGDLYWTLANLPQIPGAATQPSLRLARSSDDYLGEAEKAYQSVVKNFSNETESALAANFGLAAIAEDRHHWDDAQKIYEQIKSSKVEQMYKDLADARLKLLPDIQAPVLVGELTTKPADLSPLVMAPTSQPSSAPTSAPATQPAK
jgi:predicted negative regulator of RcsB-dependent stress response